MASVDTAPCPVGVSVAEITAAYERIRTHVHRTRVFTCDQLDQLATANSGSRRNLFLKAEHEQKIGAFKIRGAINAVKLSEADYIVTQSSGNHAQAIASGCKSVGKKAIIVMPKDSPLVKVNAVRDTYGAEVRLCTPTQEAREAMSAETVKELLEKHGPGKCEEIHPNQDLRVINGQGTVALELLEQQPNLDAIVVSIGGGGLISGIAKFVKAKDPRIKVIGAEPEAARSAFLSHRAGKLVKNPPNTPVNTVADSVKSSLGPTSYPFVRDHVDDVFTASEDEIMDATRFVLERAKQVIEPGCGLAVAVATSAQLYKRYPELRNVAVVLCGGNLDLDNMSWLSARGQKRKEVS